MSWPTGLVKGEGFAVDASVMEANASRYHGKAPNELDWTDAQRQKRAVAEYLIALDAEAQAEAERDRADASGGSDGTPAAKPDRKPPKVISPSDPQSAWTAKANKRVQFGYGLNYLIDVENAVIVDVEATPARTYDEVAATKTMIERTRARHQSQTQAADRRHGLWDGQVPRVRSSAPSITPHIPVWDKSTREDGTFSRSDFHWDKKKNVYTCPAGKVLTTTGHVSSDHAVRYVASVPDCRACSLKPKCCPNMPRAPCSARCERGCPRRGAPQDAAPRRSAKSRDERKRVEMCFAHLKTHHGFERMRLRGLSGARDEFHLAAIVQNLKRMALRLLGPSPDSMRACVA